MRGASLTTWVLVSAVTASVAVAFADSSIVVLALPELFVEFDTTVQGVSFVVTAYNIVVAAAAFAALPLIRRISPSLLAQIGLVTFIAASIGAAASGDLTILIVFRAVQGLGAALLLVAALPLLMGLTGSRASAIGLWTSAGALGAALGPALGGVLTEAFDWRAIFIVQAPIAGVALLATIGSRGRELPEDTVTDRGVPAPAANTALAFLFGALVGALFLAVLLLVAVWGLSPIEGAAVVSAIPIATVAMRLLIPHLTPRARVVGGSLLLALGLLALALLPDTNVVYATLALALCGAGLGLAVPFLSDTTISAPHGVVRSGAWSIGARHVGLVVALVLVAPLLAWELDQGATDATFGATAVIMDAPVPLSDKVPLALDLRDEFNSTPDGQIPDLEGVFIEAGVADNEPVSNLQASLLGTIEDVITRSFRTSFLLAGLFALLAIAPALAVPFGRRSEDTEPEQPEGTAGTIDALPAEPPTTAAGET